MSRHCNLSLVLQCYLSAPHRSHLFHLGLFHVDIMKILSFSEKTRWCLFDGQPWQQPWDRSPETGARWDGPAFAKIHSVTVWWSWAGHLPGLHFCSLGPPQWKSFSLPCEQKKGPLTQLITQKSPGLSRSPREDSAIHDSWPETDFQDKLAYFHADISSPENGRRYVCMKTYHWH